MTHQHGWKPGKRGRVWRCKCGAIAIRVLDAKSPAKLWFQTKWFFGGAALAAILFFIWLGS